MVECKAQSQQGRVEETRLEQKAEAFESKADAVLTELASEFRRDLTEFKNRNSAICDKFLKAASSLVLSNQENVNSSPEIQLESISGIVKPERLKRELYPFGEALLALSRFNQDRMFSGESPIQAEPSVFVSTMSDYSDRSGRRSGFEQADLRTEQVQTLLKIQAVLFDNNLPLDWRGYSAGSVEDLRVGSQKLGIDPSTPVKSDAFIQIKQLVSELELLNQELVCARKKPLDLTQLKAYQVEAKCHQDAASALLQSAYERAGGVAGTPGSSLLSGAPELFRAVTPRSPSDEGMLLPRSPRESLPESVSRNLDPKILDEIVSVYDRLQLGVPLQAIEISDRLRQVLCVPPNVGAANHFNAQDSNQLFAATYERTMCPTEIAEQSLKLPIEARSTRLLQAGNLLEDTLYNPSYAEVVLFDLLVEQQTHLGPTGMGYAERLARAEDRVEMTHPKLAGHPSETVKASLEEYRSLVHGGMHREALRRLYDMEKGCLNR